MDYRNKNMIKIVSVGEMSHHDGFTPRDAVPWYKDLTINGALATSR